MCRPDNVLVANASMEVSMSLSVASFTKSACASKPRNLLTTRGSQCELSTKREQPWEDLFANPSHWWDNRFDKLGSAHPDFRHKSTREPLWLNSPHIPSWVHAKLVSDDVLRLSSHLLREFHMLCLHGHVDIALHVLFHMPHAPTGNMYYSLLRACNQGEALHAQVKLVQTHMARDPLACDGFLGEYLVITLAKCGDIANALSVFHGLMHQTVFSWTAIISGLIDCGKFYDALNMYHLMRQDGTDPNDHTFVSLLKACGCVCDLEEGKRLHTDISKYGYEYDLFVGTALVDMYGKCGSVELAQSVFDGLPHRNVVSWTVMLSAHVEHGQPERAWELYGQMQQQEGVSPDNQAIVIALQACSMLAENDDEDPTLKQWERMLSLRRGKGLHIEACIKGFDSDVFVCNSLISLYGLCGSIIEAEYVFEQLPCRDVVSWNALLSVYVEGALPRKALQLFRQLKELNVSPDDRTFVSALQACSTLVDVEEEGFGDQFIKAGALRIGQALHSESRFKLFDLDLFVCHTIVNMYGKCGSVWEAENAFNGLLEHTVVAWNVMSLAYLRQGKGEKVLQIYKKMHEEGLVVSERTFVISLQACCLLAEKEDPVVIHDKHTPRCFLLAIGKALHADAQRRGFDVDDFVSSCLVSMYEKCGSLVEANNAFRELPQGSVQTWNAMLLAFIQRGEGGKALLLFEQMQKAVTTLTDFTLVCALQACSEKGTVGTCKDIHFALVCAGDDERLVVANTLIHAYGTCASIFDAQAIFDVLPSRDVTSWNALIGAYAHKNDWAASLHWYERMQGTSIKPDGVTFLSVFSACCHTGLVKKGLEYLASMSRDHKLTPEIGHYSIVLELLGYAGEFARVEDLLSSMPVQPDLTIWLCLLGACQMHGNVKLGRHAYNQMVHLQVSAFQMHEIVDLKKLANFQAV